MSSNIDSEIIKNLRSSGDQNTLEQTAFSSMFLNGITIQGANNISAKTTKYLKSKPKKQTSSYSNVVILSILDNGDLYVSGNQEAELVYSTGLLPNEFFASIANYGNSWLITGWIITSRSSLDATQYIKTFTISSDLEIKTFEFLLPLPVITIESVSIGWGMVFFAWKAIDEEVIEKARLGYFDMLNMDTPIYQVKDFAPTVSFMVDTVNYGVIEYFTYRNGFLTFSVPTGDNSYLRTNVYYEGVEQISATEYFENGQLLGTHIVQTLDDFNDRFVQNIINGVGYLSKVQSDLTGIIISKVTDLIDPIVLSNREEELIPYIGLTEETKNKIVSISIYK